MIRKSPLENKRNNNTLNKINKDKKNIPKLFPINFSHVNGDLSILIVQLPCGKLIVGLEYYIIN